MAKQVNSALIGKAIIARIDKAGVFHGILDYKDADITREAYSGDVIKLLDD